MIFVALSWALFSLKGPCPSCAKKHRDGCSIPGPTRQESPPLTTQPDFWCRPGFPGLKSTLLSQVPFFIHQYPQIFLHRESSQSIHPPCCTHVKGCPNPQATHPGPWTLPCWTLFQQNHLPPHQRYPGNLLGMQLHTAYVIMKVIKQFDSLRDTTHYCFHLATKPLTITPWMQLSCQCFIHQRVYHSNLLHANLIIRMLGGDTVSKALQKPR